MKSAILCTGPSLTEADVEAVRGFQVVAVNGTFALAPWAAALAANDPAWWQANPDAKNFAGRKFSASPIGGDVEQVKDGGIVTGTCSGVLGLEVAKMLGATQIILLGADMHGTHYFGDYPEGMRNTTPERRVTHFRQWKWWSETNPGIAVVNCTPGTALDCFQKARLEDVC